MNNKAINILIDYANEKHISIKDIVNDYLDGLLTIDECYNRLARRTKQTTTK